VRGGKREEAAAPAGGKFDKSDESHPEDCLQTKNAARQARRILQQ
jgi:hypothetical protein